MKNVFLIFLVLVLAVGCSGVDAPPSDPPPVTDPGNGEIDNGGGADNDRNTEDYQIVSLYLSPDETWLTYQKQYSEGLKTILRHLDSQDEIVIDDIRTNSQLFWSPNGQQLLYQKSLSEVMILMVSHPQDGIEVTSVYLDMEKEFWSVWGWNTDESFALVYKNLHNEFDVEVMDLLGEFMYSGNGFASYPIAQANSRYLSAGMASVYYREGTFVENYGGYDQIIEAEGEASFIAFSPGGRIVQGEEDKLYYIDINLMTYDQIFEDPVRILKGQWRSNTPDDTRLYLLLEEGNQIQLGVLDVNALTVTRTDIGIPSYDIPLTSAGSMIAITNEDQTEIIYHYVH